MLWFSFILLFDRYHCYNDVLEIRSWDDVISKYWRENENIDALKHVNNSKRFPKNAPAPPQMNDELKDAIYNDKTLYISSEDEYLSKRGYSCASSLTSTANKSREFLKNSNKIAHVAITGREVDFLLLVQRKFENPNLFK